MSDLISRQAALDIINAELNGWLTDDERLHLEGVGTGIECLPSIDPVKHGKWIKNEGRHGWHCSVCEKDDCFAFAWSFNNGEEIELQDFYCPNCGAKMDGGEE